MGVGVGGGGGGWRLRDWEWQLASSAPPNLGAMVSFRKLLPSG